MVGRKQYWAKKLDRKQKWAEKGPTLINRFKYSIVKIQAHQ